MSCLDCGAKLDNMCMRLVVAETLVRRVGCGLVGVFCVIVRCFLVGVSGVSGRVNGWDVFFALVRFLVGVGVFVWCLHVVLGREKNENVCESGVMGVTCGSACLTVTAEVGVE